MKNNCGWECCGICTGKGLARAKHSEHDESLKSRILKLDIWNVVKYANDLVEGHGWVVSPVLCSNEVTRTLLFCVSSLSSGFCEHPCCSTGWYACPLCHITDLPTQRRGGITMLNELESQQFCVNWRMNCACSYCSESRLNVTDAMELTPCLALLC